MAKIFWAIAGWAAIIVDLIARALDNDYFFALAAIAGTFSAVELAVHAVTGGWLQLW